MTRVKMAEAKKHYPCTCTSSSYDDRRPKLNGKCQCHPEYKHLQRHISLDSFQSKFDCPERHSYLPSISAKGCLNAPGNIRLGNDVVAERAMTVCGESSRPVRSASRDRIAGRREGSTHAPVTRRRSRSVERYDMEDIVGTSSRPPSYCSTLALTSRSRRANRNVDFSSNIFRHSTPPPSYEVAQHLHPPTYEEALSNSLSQLSTPSRSRLSALIATTPDLRAPPSTSSFAQGDAQLTQRDRLVQQARQSRRVQRQAEREAQLERERQELDLEREKQLELRVAKFCGCPKCQMIYYNYHCEESMKDGTTFPMETQVLMQDVLSDGLTFCSIM